MIALLVFTLTFSTLINIRLALRLHNIAKDLQELLESLERP